MIYTIKLNKIKEINFNDSKEYLDLFEKLEVPEENHGKVFNILTDLQVKLSSNLLCSHGESYIIIEI